MIAPTKTRRQFAETAPTPIRSEIGVPGLSQWGGYIDDEHDKRLRLKRNKLDTYREMLDDPTIAAARTALDAYVRSAKMTIEPNDATADTDAVTFIESALYEMEDSWEATLSEIMTFVDYGYSLFEVTYLERDGKNGRSGDGMIGWHKWSPRSQDTIEQWRFEDEGRTVTHAVQRFPNSGKTADIPLDFCLHFKTKNRKASPEGRSLIRPAHDPWYAKKHLQRIMRIGAERDLTGVPVVYIPIEAYEDSTKKSAWEQLVRNIRMDQHAGLVMPLVLDDTGAHEMYRVELMSTAGSRTTNVVEMIAAEERNILRVLLSDWMQLGDSGGGSFALGVSKAEMFVQFVQGLLDIIADVVTQEIRVLCEANGIPDDHAPRLTFETLSKKDVTKTASAVQMLSEAIDLTDPGVRAVLYDLLDFPVPDGGFEEVQPVVPPKQETTITEVSMDPAANPNERAAIGQGQKAFVEPVSHHLQERARNVWREALAGTELADLLDAVVVNG